MSKRVFTVQIVVEVDMDAFCDEYGSTFERAGQLAADDLEDWAEMLLAPGMRPGKWVGLASTVAGCVDGSCKWFAHCDHDAVAIANHGILGPVPVCQRHLEFASAAARARSKGSI